MSHEAHRVIFLNGVQAAGKSTVAWELKRLDPSIEILSGDDVIRQFASRDPQAIFDRVLSIAEEWLKDSTVVVDSAMTERQIRKAQARFEGRAAFVVLRIEEAERSRREALRGRRLAVPFRPEWHEFLGSDDLYDVIIDLSSRSPTEAAEMILRAVRERRDS